ncbi:MAG: hypothetical protein MUE44_32420 [Oscillatoriaceae cyanobacterium Prado104]|jgi:hypothetical protein|nr:hypothetical protein [Oscillatoriaceae cyanobacterium Prado104]
MTTKINGKFYPLQHAEWIKAMQNLKPAEINVLYYIRTLDPMADGVEVSAAAIARAISTPDKKVCRQTVSRALKALDAKGYIDMEILTAKVSINGGGINASIIQFPTSQTPIQSADRYSLDRDSLAKLTEGIESPARCVETSAVRTDTERCVQTPQGISTHHARISTHRAKNSEASQCKGFSENQPHIDFKDFKDSLSDCERASFLDFVREKTCSLPRAIVSIGDYLAAPDSSGEPRYKSFWEAFEKSSAGAPVRDSRLESELTPELYAEWEQIFLSPQFDRDFRKFAEVGPGTSELRDKFCQRWQNENFRSPFADMEISEEQMRQANREARERAKVQLQERLARKISKDK